jgi:hypothetical protein
MAASSLTTTTDKKKIATTPLRHPAVKTIKIKSAADLVDCHFTISRTIALCSRHERNRRKVCHIS